MAGAVFAAATLSLSLWEQKTGAITVEEPSKISQQVSLEN